MLRARGYDVTVANEGINGDTTSGMLRRLRSAVPDGTRLVILDKAASNDGKGNADTAANVQAIAAQLKERGIKLVVIPGMHGWANFQIQPDGIHITEQGHDAVAAHLLPLVIGAIKGNVPFNRALPAMDIERSRISIMPLRTGEPQRRHVGSQTRRCVVC